MKIMSLTKLREKVRQTAAMVADLWEMVDEKEVMFVDIPKVKRQRKAKAATTSVPISAPNPRKRRTRKNKMAAPDFRNKPDFRNEVDPSYFPNTNT